MDSSLFALNTPFKKIICLRESWLETLHVEELIAESCGRVPKISLYRKQYSLKCWIKVSSTREDEEGGCYNWSRVLVAGGHLSERSITRENVNIHISSYCREHGYDWNLDPLRSRNTFTRSSIQYILGSICNQVSKIASKYSK